MGHCFRDCICYAIFVEHVPSVYCMFGKGSGAYLIIWTQWGTNLKKRANLELGANSNINDIFFFLRRAEVSIWLPTDKE